MLWQIKLEWVLAFSSLASLKIVGMDTTYKSRALCSDQLKARQTINMGEELHLNLITHFNKKGFVNLHLVCLLFGAAVWQLLMFVLFHLYLRSFHVYMK